MLTFRKIFSLDVAVTVCVALAMSSFGLADSALAADGKGTSEPGVIVDPNSPAGVEYALPLDRGRQLSGSDRSSQAGPADSALPVSGPVSSSAAEGRQTGSRKERGVPVERAAAPAAAAAAAKAVEGEPTGGALDVGLITLFVLGGLVASAGAALLFTRRTRQAGPRS